MFSFFPQSNEIKKKTWLVISHYLVAE